MKSMIASFVFAAFFTGTALAQSSQSLRGNKIAAITAGIGLRTHELSESGIGGAYFLNPDASANLYISSIQSSIKEKANGTVDDRDLYYVGVTTEVKGSIFGATYKQFLTDTFYLEGGLDYASVEGKFRISKDIAFTDDNLESDLGSYRKLSALFQIGNQWQWENFTLGTSWVGVLAPLSTSKSFTEEARNSTSLNSVEKFKDGASGEQVTVLRFYLGWAF